jgi:hypothetical protein
MLGVIRLVLGNGTTAVAVSTLISVRCMLQATEISVRRHRALTVMWALI